MFFLPGFVMAAAGFAMVVVGQFPLGKKVVKTRPARVAGGIWISYLPLVFGARYLLQQLEWEEVIHPDVIYGVLLAICLLTGTILVLRSAYGGTGRKPRRLAAAGASNPFEPAGTVPAAEQDFLPGTDDFFAQPPPPPPAPAARKKPGRRPAPPEKNPFDFS
jgi:hypothetical protein